MVEGKPKQVTVSKEIDRRNLSVQSKLKVEAPSHQTTSNIGIDVGIASFAALLNGTIMPPIQSFNAYFQ